MKRICVLTGTRAEYGILYPVLSKIRDTEGLSLQLLATHMHFLPEFGFTSTEIERDGFSIDARVELSRADDSPLATSREMGEAVGKIAESLATLRPDLLLVVGDRPEVLAATFAANILRVPIAQVHAGEVSGHIDGVFRHAITKLSHILFPPTKAAYERILRMGEEPWRVRQVGAPALDRILTNDYTSREELMKTYKLADEQPILLIVFHPVQGEEANGGAHMRTLLEAAHARGGQTIVAYPNADSGSTSIIEILTEYKKDPVLHIRENIPHRDYLGLLRIVNVLIGNSSSGIIEAPSFGLPVVNVGSRQLGRERADNVIDVEYDRGLIEAALSRACSKEFRAKARTSQNPYGDGHASEKIVETFLSMPDTERLLDKRMTY